MDGPDRAPLRQGSADRLHLAHHSAGGGGSVAVLCGAADIGPGFGSFIEKASPLAFSVYLIHAHPLIWEHWLAGRFAFLADKPPILLASGVLGGAFAIYLVCSLADVLRAGLFRLFRVKAISRWAEEAVSARLRPRLEKE
ncbi:MAG: hypothetical protein V8R21_05955 [Dysosmobacter sp.]